MQISLSQSISMLVQQGLVFPIFLKSLLLHDSQRIKPEEPYFYEIMGR